MEVPKSHGSDEAPTHGLLRAIFVGGLSFFGGALLNFFATILSARLLGPIGRGQLAAIQVVPPIAVFLGCLGNQIALPVLISRKSHPPSSLLSNALTICAIVLVPVLVLAGILQFFILEHFGQDTQLAGYLFLTTAPFIAALGLCWSSLQGLGKFNLFATLRILPVSTYVIAVIIGARMSKHQIISIACLYLFGLFAICLPLTFAYVRKSLESKLSVDTSLCREMGKIGLPSLLSGGFVMLNQSFPQLFISRFLSPADFGLFTVGTAFGSVISLLGTSIGTALLPRAAANHDSPAVCGPTLIMGCSFSFLVAIFFLIVMPLLVQSIFGPKFDASIGVSRILVMNYLFICCNALHADTYRALSYNKIPNICECVGLCSGLFFCSLSSILAPSLGMVAYAWLAGNFVSLVMYVYFDNKFIFCGRLGYKQSMGIVLDELHRLPKKFRLFKQSRLIS